MIDYTERTETTVTCDRCGAKLMHSALASEGGRTHSNRHLAGLGWRLVLIYTAPEAYPVFQWNYCPRCMRECFGEKDTGMAGDT